MTHIEKLQDYLIKKDYGYLIKDINKGKIIMLSGIWGSGKTHFWQEKIMQNNFIKKSNIYISLYGKKSIEDIEKEVLVKAYYKSIGKINDNSDIVEKAFSVFSSTSKIIDTFFGTKINDVINEVNKKNDKHKDSKAQNFINDGLIICFDDFERKSNDVDLQDLFGFITNLSLQYKSRVVIILNSDVFDGKDKEVFRVVKEKSVNKFLMFEPNISELFEIIFSKFNIDIKYKSAIFQAIQDMKILNARVYERVLESLDEYTENQKLTNDEVRYFVFTVINFHVNHIVFKFYDYHKDMKDWSLSSNFIDLECSIDFLNILDRKIKQNSQQIDTKLELIDLIKSSITHEYKSRENKKEDNIKILPTAKLDKDIEQVDKYANLIWFFWLLEVQMKYRNNIAEAKQKEINIFIETGVL